MGVGDRERCRGAPALQRARRPLRPGAPGECVVVAPGDGAAAFDHPSLLQVDRLSTREADRV